MTRCDGIRSLWGGFEDELLLKSTADPAALGTETKLIPALPSRATLSKAYLLLKFRELYCASANYIATKGYVQLEIVTGGTWTTGITIEAGMLDVAAATPGAGDVLIGNIDISDQVADGEQVQFRLLTLRSNVDDLALRDLQCGLLMLYDL